VGDSSALRRHKLDEGRLPRRAPVPHPSIAHVDDYKAGRWSRTAATITSVQATRMAATTAPAPVTAHFNGVLLDMDGTLIDSTPAIVKHWHRLGAEMGVDPTTILASSHGRRSIDTLAEWDPSRANWDCK
jgi:hypothetical protein